MMRWRSAFQFGGLAAALCLSTALGCAIAPLEPEDEVADTESGLEADSQPDSGPDEPGLEISSEPLDGNAPEPDPIPWTPPTHLVKQSPQHPGVPVIAPDPIPWDTADSGRDTR